MRTVTTDKGNWETNRVTTTEAKAKLVNPKCPRLATTTLHRSRPAHVVNGLSGHQLVSLDIFVPIAVSGRRCPPSTSASHPTRTINTDRIHKPQLSSSSVASASAVTTSVPTATVHNPNAPTNIDPTIANTSDVDLIAGPDSRWRRAFYVDLKKAFDSVPHQHLVYKLSRTGIRRNLLRWIQSFLIGRSQIIHVCDRQSAEVAVESGVPQGSVLGPTLFIIYVNDCVSELNCDVAMFADDVKLWSVIRTELDEERLQADLTQLEKRSKDWLLPLNVTKCHVLRVGRTRSLSRRVYHLNGVPLQEVDAQKDLDVRVTASLKPSPHRSKVAKSAKSVLYLVKRDFSTFDKGRFVKVFRTFVRPELEFAIQVWKPSTSKDLSILEKVQRAYSSGRGGSRKTETSEGTGSPFGLPAGCPTRPRVADSGDGFDEVTSKTNMIASSDRSIPEQQ
ncbi:hypothetical protein SprV_0100369800 [Sparganum proliferum]